MFDEHFWVAVAFFGFIALIWKPVGRFITKALDNKILKVRAELDEALRLKQEAEAILVNYREKNKQAESEAREILENAKQEATYIIAEAKKELEYSISKRSELAQQKIEQAEMDALQSIKENAIDITISAAKSLIMENLSREATEELLLGAIDDLERKFH